jgi:hypothetical protein
MVPTTTPRIEMPETMLMALCDFFQEYIFVLYKTEGFKSISHLEGDQYC